MAFKKSVFFVLLTGIVLVTMSGCGSKKEAVVEVIGLESTENQEVSTEDKTENSEAKYTDEKEEMDQENEKWIKVYICGAVKEAGVYEMKEGARICDVLEEAGDFTKDASQTYLNQAEIITDGQKIYVPTDKEVESGTVLVPLSTENKEKKVNINTASIEELMTLTGIGEAKAKAIIAYREDNGGFTVIEDIQEISGIKEAVYNTIKDQICV